MKSNWKLKVTINGRHKNKQNYIKNAEKKLNKNMATTESCNGNRNKPNDRRKRSENHRTIPPNMVVPKNNEGLE